MWYPMDNTDILNENKDRKLKCLRLYLPFDETAFSSLFNSIIHLYIITHSV